MFPVIVGVVDKDGERVDPPLSDGTHPEIVLQVGAGLSATGAINGQRSVVTVDVSKNGLGNNKVLVTDGSGNVSWIDKSLLGGVQKKSVAFTLAELQALANGVKTLDKNLGAVLPSNARIVSATDEGVTTFDNGGGGGTYVATIGTSAGGNQIGASMNVALGQTGFPKQFAAGAQGYPFALQSGAQLSARLTSNVDLNTTTAGGATVLVFYVLVP